jgi:hypothetical protein
MHRQTKGRQQRRQKGIGESKGMIQASVVERVASSHTTPPKAGAICYCIVPWTNRATPDSTRAVPYRSELHGLQKKGRTAPGYGPPYPD